MHPSLAIIRDYAISELEPLKQERADLIERIAELDEVIGPIEASLMGLESDGKPKGKQKKSSTNGKPAKPTVTKDDVHEACITIVSENPAIKKDDLEGLLKHKLGDELGFDLRGIARRLKEVLSSKPFMVTDDAGVTIVSDASDEAMVAGTLQEIGLDELSVESSSQGETMG